MSRTSTYFLPILLLISGFRPANAQTPFWSDDLSSQALFPVQWTNGGSNNGPETWKWDDDPTGLFEGQPDFSATTAANGFMVFNSDRNGEFVHDVTITSRAIDCSGQDQVFIRFESQYAYFSAPDQSIAEVGVSTDGAAFTYYRVLEEVPSNSVSDALQIVSLELPEAANQAQVFLRFRWRGFYEYFWRIDDIGLYASDPRPEYDLVITEVLLPENYVTPLSQADDLFFAQSLANRGRESQDEVRASIIIQGSNGDQFDISETINDLTPSATDTVVYTGFFFPSDTGTYDYLYALQSEVEDANPGDNFRGGQFFISSDLFSKDDNQIIGATQPDTVREDSWLIGNYYYILNGGSEAIEAFISVASQAPLQGQSITVLLYRLSGDNNEDFDDNDLTLEGFGIYELTDEENYELLAVPLEDVNTGAAGVVLEENTGYLLMVQYTPEMLAPYSSISYGFDAIATVLKNGQWFPGGFGDEVTVLARMRIRDLSTDVEAALPEVPAITFFPNPTSDWLNLQLPQSASGPIRLQVLDMGGKSLVQTTFTDTSYRLDLRSFPSGHYLVRLQGAGWHWTQKVTRE